MKNKCKVCKYIKDEGFPFGYERGRYFIDTEGCFTDKNDKLTIKYCPTCGNLLETPELLKEEHDTK